MQRAGRNPGELSSDPILGEIEPSTSTQDGLERDPLQRRTSSKHLPFPWQRREPFSASARMQKLWSKFVEKPKARYATQLRAYGWLDWLAVVFPSVTWLRTYKLKEYLAWDLIAGLSVGFMVVPQGMSYANLAGLPSVYGLYGAFLPVLTYSVFGSSKQLAVGPVAVTSLLIASSLKELVPGALDISNPNRLQEFQIPIQEQYNHKAIQLSFIVAVLYTGVGLLRLGFLTNFLSHSVIGGFTSGAAVIIGLSQVKYLLGFNVPRDDHVQTQIANYIEGMHAFKWQEWIMGTALLTWLLVIKFIGKRSARMKWLRPLGPISACIIALVAVYAGNLQTKGIRVVGAIPQGLPSTTISWWFPLEDFSKLLPLALVVMLVDLLESTSIARALANKNRYPIRVTQEIIGLGLANFAGSLFNAYTTTGSFSRSAVNNDSGAKTGLAGFVTAWVVGFTLMFLTPVFEKLPLNVMGAIVISGVSGLFEYEQAINLFVVRKLDFLVWVTSCVFTMMLGVEFGLGIAVGLALLIVIYESAFPHTALLGRLPSTKVYRSTKQYPDAKTVPGLLIMRIDAPMYFANTVYLKDRLAVLEAKARTQATAAGMTLTYVILELSPVTHIDTTAVHMVRELLEELHERQVQLVLCNPSQSVVRTMERAGLLDDIGRHFIFARVHDAVVECCACMAERGAATSVVAAAGATAGEAKSGEGSGLQHNGHGTKAAGADMPGATGAGAAQHSYATNGAA